MKKLLITAFVIGIMLPGIANSKTEGSYFAVNAIVSEVKYFDQKEYSPGFGLSYKYSINYNNFFIAPGVYFNNNQAKTSKSVNSKTLDYSYGTRVDFGYDVSDKIALFTSVGFQSNHNITRLYEVEKKSDEDYLTYGVGLRYFLKDNVDLVFAVYDILDQKELSTDFDKKIFSAGISFNF